MNKLIVFFFPVTLMACGDSRQTARQEHISGFVDPFIGATTVGFKAGKTFPGTASPFRMVQLSPNTVTGGDNARKHIHSANAAHAASILKF
jgi:putative alpha-1,2-mannosidase